MTAELKKLWLRVLIQAIEDVCITSSFPEEQLAKSQAVAWFRDNSDDYKEVCTLADIDSGWLRSRVLKSNADSMKALLNEYRLSMSTSSARY